MEIEMDRFGKINPEISRDKRIHCQKVPFEKCLKEAEIITYGWFKMTEKQKIHESWRICEIPDENGIFNDFEAQNDWKND